MENVTVATTALTSCFGCHMSFLDIDERILKLIELVEFNKSPITDIKRFTKRCVVGLVEGGCGTEENVHVLKMFRENCDILIALGECAVMGGLPAMRNMVPLKECLDEAYIHGKGVYNPSGQYPNDPDIPLLLDRVYPIREVGKVDLCLPGCPPPADAIWEALTALLEKRPVVVPYPVLKYD